MHYIMVIQKMAKERLYITTNQGKSHANDNKPIHIPCIKSQHAKSRMHTVTYKYTTILFRCLMLSKLPLVLHFLFFACLPALSSLSSLTLSQINSKPSLTKSCAYIVNWFFDALLPLMSHFFSFSFIFPLISLACKSMSLHLPFLLFSFNS